MSTGSTQVFYGLVLSVEDWRKRKERKKEIKASVVLSCLECRRLARKPIPVIGCQLLLVHTTPPLVVSLMFVFFS